MRAIKASSALLAVAICSFSHAAEVLTVTPPRPLSPPPLVERQVTLSYPTIGAAGTNAVLVWNETAGALPGSAADSQHPTTNLVFSRIDQTGALLDHPGRPLFSRGESVGPVSVRGAGPTFYLVYTLRSGLVATRIAENGNRLFDPVIITTNTAANYRAVCNGKTLMIVHNTGIERLEFALLAENGAIISKGANTNSLFATSFEVASDGSDYLLVWGDRGVTRASRFNGTTGAYNTVNLTADTSGVAALGYGKNGYLLVAKNAGQSGQRVSVLDRDGNWVDGGENFPLPSWYPGDSSPAIYSDGGDGWILFYNSGGELRSLRITQGASGLDIEIDPYVPAEGVPTALIIGNIIQPFGDGRFLVARNLGAGVLATGPLKRSNLTMYASQGGNSIAASPFGYLAIWAQHDNVGSSTLALRFRKDGAQIDAQPVPVTDGVGLPVSCVFDGSAYVLAYLDASFSTRYARIPPTGPFALASRRINIPDGRRPFQLVANTDGRVILFTSDLLAPEDGFGETRLFVYALSTGGDIIGTNVLHGQTLVSDGPTIYSIGSEAGEIYLWQIVPGDMPQEINRRTFGPGIEAYGVSLRNAFVLVWSVASGQRNYAYIKNGLEQFRAPALLPDTPRIAASDDHLLVAWRPTLNRNRVAFQSRNLITGEIATTIGDFGSCWWVNIASAGKDFFGLTDSTRFQSQYIGRFWVTLAARPRFALTTSNSFPTASLTLQPDRDYLIETSSDLVNWQFLQHVTGVSRFEVPRPLGDLTFTRASLIPQ